MRIKIASNSVDKINGIKHAIARFYEIPETELEVSHQKTSSDVPDQPFDEETYLGALNRVNNLISSEEKIDFYVSCEAGIETFLGKYFNVQVACIYDTKTQKYYFGKSAGWQIPSEDIEIIKKSNLDSYLRNRKGITNIKQLLGEDSSREELVTQATHMALASQELC